MADIPTLTLATGAFVGTHLLLSHPLRRPLAERLGEGRFLGLYSVVAFGTLGWMISARRSVASIPDLWVAEPALWDVATILMLVAAILLAGSLFGNPASPDPRSPAGPIGPARGVYAITRHPMLWSVMLWALVHMILWGSAANLIVAGSMFILALAGAAGQDAKKLRMQGQRWRDWMDRTAFVPFAGQIGGRIGWRQVLPGWRAFALGAAIWLAASWAHQPLGAPVAGIWRWIG